MFHCNFYSCLSGCLANARRCNPQAETIQIKSTKYLPGHVLHAFGYDRDQIHLRYAYCMSQVSPTAEGFRAALRRPLFAFAEITWRWVVGTTAIVLFFFGLIEFLNTLPVSSGEVLFLKSGQAFLISQAIARIFRGTLYRGVMSFTLAALLVSALWLIAASLGRTATLRAIFDHVREQIRRKAPGAAVLPIADNNSARTAFPTLLRLNFLRLSVFLASGVAIIGASIIAGFASTNAGPRPGLVFVLFLPVAALIGLACFCLNWLLSFAAVFAVRNGADVIGAMDGAVTVCRERPGAVFAVSFWTALAHLVAFVAATTVVSVPLSLVAVLPWRLVVLALIVLTLLYFAVADWIYTARVAGYAAILEIPEALWLPPRPISPRPPPAPVSTIDKEELILSDQPNLAPQS